MIDPKELKDLKDIITNSRALLIALAVTIALAIWGMWQFKGYGGSVDVNKTLDQLNTAANLNQRRAENIIEAAKQKEEEHTNETREKMALVSDDHLPDLLAGLLADYRKQHPGR